MFMVSFMENHFYPPVIVAGLPVVFYPPSGWQESTLMNALIEPHLPYHLV
jgi:hypothetical protein